VASTKRKITVTTLQGELVYLDHNSTTPVLPDVVAAMRPFWSEIFANPASAHRPAQRARQALESARETIAAILDADPREVYFTSGGTEANNLAIFGLAGETPMQLVSSAIEHPSVAAPFEQLRKRGFPVTLLAVDSDGVVELKFIPPAVAAIHSNLHLAAVMLANNETGAVQPVAKLLDLLHQSCESTGQAVPWFHCDAVQAVGKIPVSFHQLGVTTLSLSAHKFNGPRGIGALLVRRGVTLQPLLYGGHQQQGYRPGTEAVALAVGMAKALELAHQAMSTRTAKLRVLRQQFLDRLSRLASPLVLNGPSEGGLPHTVNVSFPGCEAPTLLIQLDLAGVACSTGSACSSGSLLPSPVLQAMQRSPDLLRSAIRFSLSHLLSESDIDEATRRIGSVVERLRST
jgi:cysteine desulfurase